MQKLFDSDGVEEDSDALMMELKEGIARKLPSERIIEYDLRWNDKGTPFLRLLLYS